MNAPDVPNINWKTTLTIAVVLIAAVSGIAAASHLANTVSTSGSIPMEAQDGMLVFVEGTTQQNMETNFPTSGSVEAIAEEGNISFFSSGDATATVQVGDITGTYTNVTGITADPNTITIDPEDKPQAIVGQEIDEFAWRSGITEDDGTVDFSYDASGPGEVAVQGVSGSTEVFAVDAATNAILDSATSSGAGEVTFDSLEAGDHDVVIQTGVNDAPTLSNPDPTGNLAEQPNEVSIDVNDSNFPQGDSTTVTIDIDGSQATQETISSNSTVTATVPQSGLDGGTHTWSVDAEDSFGATTSDSYSYTVPDELTVFNESDPSEVVDDVDTELQFYRGDDVFTRSTSDGTIDLTDLPVSGDIVVRAEADSYYTRRTYLASIYEQQSVYLLPQNANTSQVVFQLDDRTGNFPAGDTVLRIQRPLTKDFNEDGNETTEWRTIAGDYFGASGSFPAELTTGQRYRLTVENQEGDMRSLGSYTVTGDATEPLPIGQVQFGETQSGTAVLQGTLVDHNDSRYIRVAFRDEERRTSQLEYRIVNTSDSSDVLQPNVTVAGPLRSYSETVQVPDSAPENVGYVIKWEATRTDAEDRSGEVFVGDTPQFLRGLGLDPTVASLLAFVALAALVGFVVIYDDRLAALTGVLGGTALTMGGIIVIHPIALGLAGTIALLYMVARSRT